MGLVRLLIWSCKQPIVKRTFSYEKGIQRRMKTLFLCISFLLSGLAYGQAYAEFTLSVEDEMSKRQLDSVFVHVYQDDSLVDVDSSHIFWGQGQFKSFFLEVGPVYKFVISKQRYVSKMGLIETACIESKSAPYQIPMPLFVSLFPACDAANYDWMKDTPLIVMQIDEDYHQSWDKSYVSKMNERIQASQYGNLTEAQIKQYRTHIQNGQSKLGAKAYDEAMELFIKGKEILDCFEVNYLIKECQDRKEGYYDPDSLALMIDKAMRANDYEKANHLFYLWEINIKGEGMTPERKNDKEYCRWVRLGDRAMKDKEYETAAYYFERAKDIYATATYPNERLKELDVLIEENE